MFFIVLPAHAGGAQCGQLLGVASGHARNMQRQRERESDRRGGEEREQASEGRRAR